jgi:hypothetical protein
MSDLHSLIRRSIIDRGLSSADARHEVYEQARTAIIRELWSYDPPLAEDEIDARVGQFDLAIAALEDDLADAFSVQKGPPRALAPPPAKRSAPVFEGYDRETDYVPTYVAPARQARQPSPPDDERPRPDRPARPNPGRTRVAEAADPLALRSAAIEAALRGGNEAYPPTDDVPTRANDEAIDDQPEIEAFDEAHLADEVEEVYEREQPASWAWEDGQPRSPEYDDHGAEYDDEPEPAEPPARRFAKPKMRWPTPPAWAAVLPRLADIDEKVRVRFLIGAIAGLAVVLLVIAGFILSSLLPGSTESAPERAATASAPATDDAAPANPVRANRAPADAAQSFTIFDGTDPTIFESGPGNPVRFDKSGSFARISSSASDQGARVIVGPGIATRLSGRTVRVSLVARAARDNGAAGLRFAYENGLAISPWQTANLTNQFQSYNLTWRVPAIRADPNADQLLIEPGIPGDGTAADVQLIRIDVVSE